MTKKDDLEQSTIEYDTKGIVEQKDNELKNRINKLYGDEPLETKELKEYNPKEIAQVRKKLLFLLAGVIIMGFVIIILLLHMIFLIKMNILFLKNL